MEFLNHHNSTILLRWRCRIVSSAVTICAFTMTMLAVAQDAGSGDGVAQSTAAMGSEGKNSGASFVRLDTQHLPNAIQIHPKVISGGLPADRQAFSELKTHGVKTIISVDGQSPDAKTAREFGMRYVHLPHGYSGISPQRISELAKAIQELPGPIYIHCHHGKHRSPAAATAACITAGFIPAQGADSILLRAGTSHHYEGLYKSVQKATPVALDQLKQLTVTFTERGETAPLVENMVSIEHIFSELRVFEKNDWHLRDEHPDLSPAHQALLLKEQFRETHRSELKSRPHDYLKLLKSSETAAKGIEQLIRLMPASDDEKPHVVKLGALMKQLEKNCQRCHRQYRDRPLTAN